MGAPARARLRQRRRTLADGRVGDVGQLGRVLSSATR